MRIASIILTLSLLFTAVTLTQCKKGGSPSTGGSGTGTTPGADTPIYKGADPSWLTQMEASAYKFYDSAGASMDCLQLLQTLGINSIRLRVWVNPSGGWCGTSDLVAKAVRAHNLGLRVMVDFHYSDTWADPGHQTIPAAWTGLSVVALSDTLYSYTVGVLDTLKAAGVVPSWVQVGNETDNGMLWPFGEASTNMVIVHLSDGYDNTHFRWLFDGLTTFSAKWDIIGMSLYPSASDWAAYND